MKSVNLLLGTHNHQPVGNFDSVFLHAYNHAYRPFLDMLERFPKIKVTQHYTGILLDWFRSNQPGILKQIKRLVESGQIEIMGGAYYEAILTVIPDRDKLSQLDKLSKSVKKEFGVRPSGMWLAERVWEQHLTRFIADAGLKYIVIDDTHFKYAGYADEELLGYYQTEDQGRTVSIFPISKMLRYTIPFQSVQNTIDHLRSVATEEGDRIVVFADDGEKFGVWPKTFDHVYKNGWLEQFFTALSENSDWIKINHFSDMLGMVPPVGRTYLPNASYAEMMHWALPAHHFKLYDEFEAFLKSHNALERYESFFKGGFWRNFLVKYEETNNMHKKMTRVSNRAHRMAERGKRIPAKTFEKIWSAQCNDPYWHGVFGGLYLPVLRYPAYHNLISAEGDLDRVEKKNTVSVETSDFDCDGKKEILIETPLINCYLTPDRGGSLFELDFKPISLNLLDIVSRKEEGYHHKLAEATHGPSGNAVASIHNLVVAKEAGLEDHLNYDWYRHGSLVDHFFGTAATLTDVWRCKYPEEGDFVNQPYTARVTKAGKSVFVQLDREGGIWRDGIHHRLAVVKRIRFSADSPHMTVEYAVRNLEQTPIDVCFGVEWCVGLQAGNMPDRYYFSEEAEVPSPHLASKDEIQGISMLGLRDEWLGVEVRIECGTPATFWRFPLETISLSEAGFERIYQGSVVIPHWKFSLEKEWKCTMTQRITNLKQKRNKR